MEMRFGMFSSVGRLYQDLIIKTCLFAETHKTLLLFVLGLTLLSAGIADSALAQGAEHQRYYEACNRLLMLIEGPFGALVCAAAGVGAVVMAALGGFKMAWALVVVSVGAFILRAYITLFFAGC